MPQLMLTLDRHEVWKIYAYLIYLEAGRTPPRGLEFHVEPIKIQMENLLEATHGANALTLLLTSPETEESLG